jgi:hypothetical protein
MGLSRSYIVFCLSLSLFLSLSSLTLSLSHTQGLSDSIFLTHRKNNSDQIHTEVLSPEVFAFHGDSFHFKELGRYFFNITRSISTMIRIWNVP